VRRIEDSTWRSSHEPCARSSDFSNQRNGRAVQLLLGHTKLERTVPQLGIEVDDAVEIAEQTEV
jgi:hypothetical protein